MVFPPRIECEVTQVTRPNPWNTFVENLTEVIRTPWIRKEIVARGHELRPCMDVGENKVMYLNFRVQRVFDISTTRPRSTSLDNLSIRTDR